MGRMTTWFDPKDPKHTHAQERLRAETIVWLTTVDADGQPQSTPVWFWWDGETFLVYSRAGAKKVLNIAANPRVALHLEGNRVGGDNVIYEGTAEAQPDAPPANEVPEYIEKYRQRIETYAWTPESFANDYPDAFRITPTRVRIW
jgi:PPOX class probable F420-dependent enzyme